MDNTIFWLIYIALIFWAIYQKWDEKNDKFLEFPYLTTLYFILGSYVIAFFFNPVISFFEPDRFGISFVIIVLLFTYFVYKLLNKIKKKEVSWPFRDYFQLLDERYIIPKFAEIIFQQVFFASIFVISLNSFGANPTLIITTIAFALAHINLFLFKSFREAIFYLLFSVVGAPVFILLIMSTETLWLSIGVHLLFYTLLSVSAWTWNVIKK